MRNAKRLLFTHKAVGHKFNMAGASDFSAGVGEEYQHGRERGEKKLLPADFLVSYVFTIRMKDNSELKGLVNSWRKDLNRVVANWDLIPGSPEDEFDLLTDKLIGHLTRGSKKEKIYQILESELIARYGLSPTESELNGFAVEIVDWWMSKE